MAAALEKKSSDKKKEREEKEVGEREGHRNYLSSSCMFIFRVITNEVNLNRMKLILLSAGKSSSAGRSPLSSLCPHVTLRTHLPQSECLDMCVTMDPNGRAIHLELLPRSRAYTARNWNQCPPPAVVLAMEGISRTMA